MDFSGWQKFPKTLRNLYPKGSRVTHDFGGAEAPMRPRWVGAIASRHRSSVMRVAAALSLLLFLSSAAFASLFCYGMYHSPIFDAAPLPSVGDGFRGVNLGGWLVLEPWITPSLFYPWLCYGSVCPDDLPPVIDEASFCQRLGPAEASRRLRVHRESWVNRSTFERIAALGLNVVRLPYGHWVFGDSNDVCPGVSSIEYVDRAVEWAEATGLRLILDMHGVDAGANGMDNSGVSHKPPWARAWGRRDFDAKAWARPPHVAVTRRVLRRVAARYANRSGSVVRLGLVNEPLLSAQPLWCPAGCPMQTSELLRYYAGTWPSLANTTVTHGANTTAGETPWGGVLDAGLGGSVGGWVDALTRRVTAVFPPCNRRVTAV